MTLPVGVVNCNPCNLRPLPNGQLWLGQTGVDANHLCVFEDVEHGIRAAARNLRSYMSAGINTVRSIYAAWAPTGDGSNDPDSYAAFVSNQTGYQLDECLDATQPVLIALIKASALQENGWPPGGAQNWYSDDIFVVGVALAFV